MLNHQADILKVTRQEPKEGRKLQWFAHMTQSIKAFKQDYSRYHPWVQRCAKKTGTTHSTAAPPFICKDQRWRPCKEAQIVSEKDKKLLPKGQKSIASYAPAPPLRGAEYHSLATTSHGTRAFPHFLPGRSNDLPSFDHWLQGMERMHRSEDQAKEIVTNVSKVLR